MTRVNGHAPNISDAEVRKRHLPRGMRAYRFVTRFDPLQTAAAWALCAVQIPLWFAVRLSTLWWVSLSVVAVALIVGSMRLLKLWIEIKWLDDEHLSDADISRFTGE